MHRSGWITWAQQEAKPDIFWRRLSCERAARIGNPKGPGSGRLELPLGGPVGRRPPTPAQGCCRQGHPETPGRGNRAGGGCCRHSSAPSMAGARAGLQHLLQLQQSPTPRCRSAAQNP
jgi:hypothetical protein